MLVIITGAYQFFQDLLTSIKKVRAIRNPQTDEEDVIIKFFLQKASSYHSGMESSGNVVFNQEGAQIEGKHVLVIEDVYDSGQCMKKIIENIMSKKCKSLKTCVLIHKKNHKNLMYDYFCDYIGFYCPNKFIIGYGMDFNEYFRDMEHICAISEHAIQKYKE